MKRMVRAALIMTACAALAAGAWAAETPEERAKRVIQEAVQALGGDAFLHMNDRVESGRAYSFYRSEISGLSTAKIYTRYLAPAPAVPAMRERENFGAKEDAGVLLTEEGAWDITYRGARPLPDNDYARFRDSTLRNVLYILRQRLNEPGMGFYSQGADFLENRPVEIVDITDSRNETVTVYFDQLNKLPVRQSFRRRNPEFKDFDTEVTIFALYKDVGGGVKWPYNIRRERNKEKIFEMFSDSVQINRDLKDDLFSLPAGMKVLPKAK
jgi:hypothetical protein